MYSVLFLLPAFAGALVCNVCLKELTSAEARYSYKCDDVALITVTSDGVTTEHNADQEEQTFSINALYVHPEMKCVSYTHAPCEVKFTYSPHLRCTVDVLGFKLLCSKEKWTSWLSDIQLWFILVISTLALLLLLSRCLPSADTYWILRSLKRMKTGTPSTPEEDSVATKIMAMMANSKANKVSSRQFFTALLTFFVYLTCYAAVSGICVTKGTDSCAALPDQNGQIVVTTACIGKAAPLELQITGEDCDGNDIGTHPVRYITKGPIFSKLDLYVNPHTVIDYTGKRTVMHSCDGRETLFPKSYTHGKYRGESNNGYVCGVGLVHNFVLIHLDRLTEKVQRITSATKDRVKPKIGYTGTNPSLGLGNLRYTLNVVYTVNNELVYNTRPVVRGAFLLYFPPYKAPVAKVDRVEYVVIGGVAEPFRAFEPALYNGPVLSEQYEVVEGNFRVFNGTRLVCADLKLVRNSQQNDSDTSPVLGFYQVSGDILLETRAYPCPGGEAMVIDHLTGRFKVCVDVDPHRPTYSVYCPSTGFQGDAMTPTVKYSIPDSYVTYYQLNRTQPNITFCKPCTKYCDMYAPSGKCYLCNCFYHLGTPIGEHNVQVPDGFLTDITVGGDLGLFPAVEVVPTVQRPIHLTNGEDNFFVNRELAAPGDGVSIYSEDGNHKIWIYAALERNVYDGPTCMRHVVQATDPTGHCNGAVSDTDTATKTLACKCDHTRKVKGLTYSAHVTDVFGYSAFGDVVSDRECDFYGNAFGRVGYSTFYGGSVYFAPHRIPLNCTDQLGLQDVVHLADFKGTYGHTFGNRQPDDHIYGFNYTLIPQHKSEATTVSKNSDKSITSCTAGKCTVKIDYKTNMPNVGTGNQGAVRGYCYDVSGVCVFSVFWIIFVLVVLLGSVAWLACKYRGQIAAVVKPIATAFKPVTQKVRRRNVYGTSAFNNLTVLTTIILCFAGTTLACKNKVNHHATAAQVINPYVAPADTGASYNDELDYALRLAESGKSVKINKTGHFTYDKFRTVVGSYSNVAEIPHETCQAAHCVCRLETKIEAMQLIPGTVAPVTYRCGNVTGHSALRLVAILPEYTCDYDFSTSNWVVKTEHSFRCDHDDCGPDLLHSTFGHTYGDIEQPESYSLKQEVMDGLSDGCWWVTAGWQLLVKRYVGDLSMTDHIFQCTRVRTFVVLCLRNEDDVRCFKHELGSDIVNGLRFEVVERDVTVDKFTAIARTVNGTWSGTPLFGSMQQMNQWGAYGDYRFRGVNVDGKPVVVDYPTKPIIGTWSYECPAKGYKYEDRLNEYCSVKDGSPVSGAGIHQFYKQELVSVGHTYRNVHVVGYNITHQTAPIGGHTLKEPVFQVKTVENAAGGFGHVYMSTSIKVVDYRQYWNNLKPVISLTNCTMILGGLVNSYCLLSYVVPLGSSSISITVNCPQKEVFCEDSLVLTATQRYYNFTVTPKAGKSDLSDIQVQVKVNNYLVSTVSTTTFTIAGHEQRTHAADRFPTKSDPAATISTEKVKGSSWIMWVCLGGAIALILIAVGIAMYAKRRGKGNNRTCCVTSLVIVGLIFLVVLGIAIWQIVSYVQRIVDMPNKLVHTVTDPGTTFKSRSLLATHTHDEGNTTYTVDVSNFNCTVGRRLVGQGNNYTHGECITNCKSPVCHSFSYGTQCIHSMTTEITTGYGYACVSHSDILQPLHWLVFLSVIIPLFTYMWGQGRGYGGGFRRGGGYAYGRGRGGGPGYYGPPPPQQFGRPPKVGRAGMPSAPSKPKNVVPSGGPSSMKAIMEKHNLKAGDVLSYIPYKTGSAENEKKHSLVLLRLDHAGDDLTQYISDATLKMVGKTIKIKDCEVHLDDSMFGMFLWGKSIMTSFGIILIGRLFSFGKFLMKHPSKLCEMRAWFKLWLRNPSNIREDLALTTYTDTQVTEAMNMVVIRMVAEIMDDKDERRKRAIASICGFEWMSPAEVNEFRKSKGYAEEVGEEEEGEGEGGE